jgi:hypothetical protein
VKLIIHVHLEPRLSMRGAVPLLPQCAFMAFTGVILPLQICHSFVYGCNGLRSHLKQNVAVAYC